MTDSVSGKAVNTRSSDSVAVVLQPSVSAIAINADATSPEPTINRRCSLTPPD